MQVGEELYDLKRPNRIGTILAICGRKAEVAWNTGATTKVRTRFLGPNSRHYAIISARTPRPVELPSTVRACFTAKGPRCWACRTLCHGNLVRPWRALYWTTGAWAGRCTLVCSDRCMDRLRRLEG